MDMQFYLREAEKLQWRAMSELHARAVRFLSTPQTKESKARFTDYYIEAKAAAEKMYPVLKIR